MSLCVSSGEGDSSSLKLSPSSPLASGEFTLGGEGEKDSYVGLSVFSVAVVDCGFSTDASFTAVSGDLPVDSTLDASFSEWTNENEPVDIFISLSISVSISVAEDVW